MALRQDDRWEARPRTAAALKVLVYLVPFVASGVAARFAQVALRSNNPSLHWATAALISFPIAIATLFLVGHAMRRLLPLALLLKLSLLFPDQVPSRLGVALRAASPKRLAKKAAKTTGEEAVAAEDILALVTALGAHDRKTRGHSERVRAVTMLIADELNLKGEARDKLEWAALLHDLGKLDVPGEILNKNGRPTDDEWEILRQHPGNGPAHAAGLAPWLGEWIHAMDQHHERFDGTGYPLGLTAEDIALSGRIVAVSDAFEVMTATRSYKKPMTTQAARDELVACAGAHFDPTVVRSFLNVSLQDINKALGPGSWLASIPFIGTVSTVGAGSVGRILGGSVSPALAASVALVIATPLAAASASPAVLPDAIAATVDVDGSEETGTSTSDPDGPAAGSESRDVDAGPDDNADDLSDPATSDETETPGDNETPDDEDTPDDPADDPEDDEDLTEIVEDTTQTVVVLAGDLLNELGVDELLEPVQELIEPVVENIPTPVLEDMMDPIVEEPPAVTIPEPVSPEPLLPPDEESPPLPEEPESTTLPTAPPVLDPPRLFG